MNELKQLDAFKKVLTDYHMSADSQAMLRRTKLVLLEAISSSGRNTIIRELVKSGNFHYIVSDTTRSPRINDGVMEQNGVEYWFRKEADMLTELKRGDFIEAALIHNQQVSGISKRELERANQEGKIAITDIEIAGTQTIIEANPETLAIFVLTPSYVEWQRRLKLRGHMSEREVRNRMGSAKRELQAALRRPYYHFVINDQLAAAVRGIDKMAHGKIDPQHEAEGRAVATEILQQLS